MSVKIVHRPTRTTTPMTRPDAEIIAPPPPLSDDQGGRTPLQFLLPIIGAMSSVVMMVVMRNGQPLFMVVAGLVFVVAIVGGVGFAISSRGQQAKQHRIKRELYLDYLETLRRDLTKRTAQTRLQAASAHPEPAALIGVVRDPCRLWDRRRHDDDFLTIRLGTGTVPWFDLSIPPASSPMEPHDSSLLAQAELVVDRAQRIDLLPVAVDLREAAVIAVIGDRSQAIACVRSMLLQIATAHGPDDVCVAAAFPRERAQDWAGLDLLPHVQDPELFDGPVPARRVAADLDSLAAVLGTSLTDRLQHVHAARRTGVSQRLPSRLIIVCDDYGNRAAQFPVDAAATLHELGITLIHVLADRLDEPRDVDVRITLAESALLEVASGTPAAQEFEFDADQTGTPLFEATTRAMSAMRVSLTAAADTEGDRTLNIYELLEIDGLDDVDPELLWRARTPSDFLRVPFGCDDRGNPVHLDLKESAQLGMGPHGICIGATGSGKSEMLRTLILSLALTHPPEDLSMILVDYKGGAAFAPFADLPHLAGLIDNLADDPQLTTRARASIQGEVVRRQRLLKDAGSSPSISHYRELRAQDPSLAPMPHLFVVIDEFGELLTAEPDFIDLFLQIGRIGRSIGVHLLLSSQRIEGGKLRGLDTYLSYRLGLRTFSEAESQVVLNSSDAYHLPALPGFGYLKVDTSVYTRFRAGYVSGPVEHTRTSTDHDAQLRPLLLPVYNGITDDRAAHGAPLQLTRPDTGRSLIDESVSRIRNDDRAVRPVWLPPLPDRLALGLVLDQQGQRPPGLTVIVGLEDDPAKQAQNPWRLDLGRAGGHVAVIGAPQSGRSTVLRTIAASLALTYTPREVAIYGMDLTGGGLQRIEDFPHVGGVATRSHRDRLVRLIEELAGMLAQREAIFKSHGIDSMPQLRTMHAAGRIPELAAADVVLLVDGYGQIRQDFEDLENPFIDIMLRAASFGIHLVFGLTRWSELRMGHQALFGTRLELRLNDPAESSIDRKLSTTLSAETPGRVILDNRNFAHVALPILDDVPDDSIGDELEELARRTAKAWSGPAAAPIRLLPLHVSTVDLPDPFDEPDQVPMGLRQDTMDAALWDFAGEDQHLIVLGDTKSGKTTLLRTLALGLTARFTSDELAIAVIDVRGHVPDVIDDDYLAAHARNAKQARGVAESIASELEKRPSMDAALRARAPRIVVLVDDYDIVSAGGTDPLAPLLPYLPSARDLGLHLVIARPVAGASRAMYSQMLQVTRDTGGSMLLMSGERSEGQLANRIYPERFPPGRGKFIRRGTPPRVIQVAQTPEDSHT